MILAPPVAYHFPLRVGGLGRVARWDEIPAKVGAGRALRVVGENKTNSCHLCSTMSATMTTTATTVDSVPAATTSNLATIELDGYDEEQIRLMEERCILVDNDDKAYGDVSKKACQSFDPPIA